MKRASARTIERVRKICLALPDTFEKISHGEPTWFAIDRTFAMFSNNHHNDGNIAVLCNAPEGAQQALIEAEPEHIYKPPYVGPGGWIGIRLDAGFDWKTIEALIKQAYETTINARSRKRARSATRARAATARAR